jgi:hypothetical protein
VRAPTNPWLVPGLVAGLTVILATAGVQVAVRAVRWLALSLAMPRPAGVAWTALVPAGLNATLWERRQPTGEHGRRRGG